jgi:hypothetical protein
VAKLAGDKKVSLQQISQEIDIKEYLGEKPTPEQKRIFAEIARDVIENRTLDGVDINGKKFKKYSKEYAELKGVGRSAVDLFLKGDMLSSIGRRKSKEKTNTVFLQMKKGLETKKSFNHDTGDNLPRREFFGITEMEAKKIASEVERLTASKKKVTLSMLELAAASILLGEDDENQDEIEELG